MTVPLSMWLAPTSSDPEVARQQYVLNRVLVGVGGLSLVLWLASVWAWLMGYSPAIGMLYTFVQIPFYGLAYWLGRQGRVRLAAYIPTGILFLTMLAILIRLGIGHSTLVGLALATVMAGVLIGVWPAVILALLCTASYAIVGLVQRAGRLPRPVMPGDSLAADSLALGIALLALAVIVWLSHREVRRALGEALESQHQALAYAQVLEEIREQLEAEVDRRTESAHQLEASLAEQQRLWNTVEQLSIPIIPVHEGVIVTPLIGHMDAARTERLMDNLLATIEAESARVVIVDVTGVPEVDTQVAQAVKQTAKATRLLGAETILVGIRPEVAQTLIALGVKLGDVVTRRDLQSGFQHALTILGQQLTVRPPGFAPQSPGGRSGG